MFFQRIKTPGLAHNAYLIGTQGIGILVDPRRDIAEYIKIASQNKLSIQYVLETHRQEDFVLGSAEVRKVTGAKIVSGQNPLSAHSDQKLADGESLKIGEFEIRLLETPGHTPESVSYAFYHLSHSQQAWAVFTGDALFIGETGRTDLPDKNKTAENAKLLYTVIRSKIGPLGDATLLYPAHGSGSACGGNIASYDESTIGFEKTYNYVFKMSEDEFVEHKLNERIPRPPYFKLMEVLNLKGGISLPQKVTDIPCLQPKEFQQRFRSGIVIDTRLPESFAGGHIPNSFSIWLEGVVAFGGWIADDKTEVYLVLEREDDLEKVFLSLSRVGVDNIKGFLAGGFQAWRDAGLPIQMAETTAADRRELPSTSQVPVLDVRDITEYESGHIPLAKHAYVGYLNELKIDHADLDPEKPVTVTCGVGHRASLAVSILQRKGFKHVANLLGGMTAWKKLDLPLEAPCLRDAHRASAGPHRAPQPESPRSRSQSLTSHPNYDSEAWIAFSVRLNN